MISSHTLAKEIIARHNDPCPVRDEEGRFARDSAQATSLLRNSSMHDDGADPADTTASAKGSLMEYIAATYGSDSSALTEEEVSALREWFVNGRGRAGMKGLMEEVRTEDGDP